MLERIVTGGLLVVSVIHLLPVSGFIGARKLSQLYGIDITDPNLEILMRHRAVLFGILGVVFGYAAFEPALQPMAFSMGFASVLSFFYLSYTVSDFNGAIRRVVIADIIALLALVLSVTAYGYQSSLG